MEEGDNFITKKFVTFDNYSYPFQVVIEYKNEKPINVRVFQLFDKEYYQLAIEKTIVQKTHTIDIDLLKFDPNSCVKIRGCDELDSVISKAPILEITDFLDVFIGYSPKIQMTNFSGGFGPEFDGNSILVKLTQSKYILIGSSIKEFETQTEITDFFSPVGNNLVCYSWAEDDIGNCYLLAEDVFATKRENMFDIENGENPYTDFYYIIKDTDRCGQKYHKTDTIHPIFGKWIGLLLSGEIEDDDSDEEPENNNDEEELSESGDSKEEKPSETGAEEIESSCDYSSDDNLPDLKPKENEICFEDEFPDCHFYIGRWHQNPELEFDRLTANGKHTMKLVWRDLTTKQVDKLEYSEFIHSFDKEIRVYPFVSNKTLFERDNAFLNKIK